MMKVLATAILTLGLAGSAMALSSGSSTNGGSTDGTSGTSNGGGNTANGAAAPSDQGGSVDKCKTGATGKTTTTDAATTKQEAKSCPYGTTARLARASRSE